MQFLTSDLKKKLIASAGTFRRNLCKMVEYKVLQSRVEIDPFLTLILFSMVTIGKEVCTTRNFLQSESSKPFYENFLQYQKSFGILYQRGD